MHNDYDLLPYISMPIVYSQPARLAALATLHGLAAPAAECARVLELGCASGGNIIPLAARYPRARFLGLDISQTHVEAGRRRIAALGLRNIEIRREDVAASSFAGDRFDYILCHGVFSWVPRAVQDAIFRVCAQHLTDPGVAVISYNVLPGWHLRNVVRGICLRHAGAEGSPHERVARAREILDAVAGMADAADPYGHVVRGEAARIARQPASYILGEFLASDNAPCTFGEFAARAAQFDLTWLCEGDLPSSAPETFAPKAAARIRAFAGDNETTVQEYTDVFSGRTFRRSVVVRSTHAAQRSQPSPDRLRGLHVASAIKPDPAGGGDRPPGFIDHRGGSIEVNHPAVHRAFTQLAERFPSTSSLSELTGRGSSADHEQRISKAVFRLLTSGRALVSSVPLNCGGAGADFPRVWPLARAEAAAGQPWVTSPRHTSVILTQVLRVLMPWLDGKHDRESLAALIASAHRAGTIELGDVRGAPGAPATDTPVEALAVDHALRYLAVNALLLPD